MAYDKDILKRIADYLNVRFPIATFARDLGYSKGVVSEYYNGKKAVSEQFIDLVEKKYNIRFDDFKLGGETFLLNEGLFTDKEKLGTFVRFLTKYHDRLKEDELYRLFLDKVVLENENEKKKMEIKNALLSKKNGGTDKP